MRPSRFSSLPTVAATLGAFCVAILLVDSSGVHTWAERLPLGPERTVAFPLADALDRLLKPLRLGELRHHELVLLAKSGWGDDPTLLAPPAIETATPAAAAPAEAGHIAAAGEAIAAAKLPVLPKPPVFAGTLIAPPVRTMLPDLHLRPAKEPVTLALAGDSMMAVGLYPSLSRLGSGNADLKIVRAFKSGTGLARPEVYNWMTQYPALLGEAKPRVVFVAIGANDGQGFIEDGTTYPFGTAGWVGIYRARVEAYLSMLEAGGARVIWLELPPMRSDVYDGHIEVVNEIDYAVVSAHPGAVWISTRPTVGDAEGRYREYGEVHKSMTRLRQADGIHLSDAGADLVAEPLMEQLRAQMQEAAATPNEPAKTPTSSKPDARKAIDDSPK